MARFARQKPIRSGGAGKKEGGRGEGIFARPRFRHRRISYFVLRNAPPFVCYIIALHRPIIQHLLKSMQVDKNYEK